MLGYVPLIIVSNPGCHTVPWSVWGTYGASMAHSIASALKHSPGYGTQDSKLNRMRTLMTYKLFQLYAPGSPTYKTFFKNNCEAPLWLETI